MKVPYYALSKRQAIFVREAETQGLKVDYTYSGRGMYGVECPSVDVEDLASVSFGIPTRTDTLGTGYVIYVP